MVATTRPNAMLEIMDIEVDSNGQRRERWQGKWRVGRTLGRAKEGHFMVKCNAGVEGCDLRLED
jgi:hypothetical protein